ncbi:MAG TPA: amidohydrolase family protein [Pseudolabrys sp.]|jgi:predicted TIM-barrel fold metal-dependent hydrolase|nr:amidohydrolase family protein [Pseudolabrys sp.]
MTPVVDAHHHIWHRKDLPWLDGPMQPRIFGPYEPIRRDYPIEAYLADLAGSGVAKSVYVQANWPKDRSEDEVAYCQRAADETGFPHGIVGYADFLATDVRPQLERLIKYPNMRGLRMQLHWHENPQYRIAATADIVRDPLLQKNIAHLDDYGWTFDLQVFAGQMNGAAELAARCPKVTFILQHAGMLEDLSAAGWETWRSGMRGLAAQPNIMCKLSALGTFIHRNEPDHIAKIVSECMAIFGPTRCLFGSNFPIEKLWTQYADVVAAYRRALEPFGEEAARSVLHDTATRVYRLE